MTAPKKSPGPELSLGARKLGFVLISLTAESNLIQARLTVLAASLHLIQTWLIGFTASLASCSSRP